MIAEKIAEKILEIIRNHVDKDLKEKVAPESKLIDDLKLDSLSTIEIVMEIEDQCGITVPEEEVAKLKTVQDVVEYVSNKP